MITAGMIDWDGTLADTKYRQYNWFKEWARQNNTTLSSKDATEFFEVYNSIVAQKDVQAVYDHFNLPCDIGNMSHPVWPAYGQYKKNNPVKLFDGMSEAIHEIWKMGRLNSNSKRNRAMRLAINSTNSWSSIFPDLERFNLSHMFDSYCTAETLDEFVGEGGDSTQIHKPSKVSTALLLNILDSRGENTFYIGDTIADLRATHDVRRFESIKGEHLITIGVSWGFEGRDRLEKGYTTPNSGTIHFTQIADHPSQLVEIIREYQ